VHDFAQGRAIIHNENTMSHERGHPEREG
jgi:hypothetical protein